MDRALPARKPAPKAGIPSTTLNGFPASLSAATLVAVIENYQNEEWLHHRARTRCLRPTWRAGDIAENPASHMMTGINAPGLSGAGRHCQELSTISGSRRRKRSNPARAAPSSLTQEPVAHRKVGARPGPLRARHPTACLLACRT